MLVVKEVVSSISKYLVRELVVFLLKVLWSFLNLFVRCHVLSLLGYFLLPVDLALVEGKVLSLLKEIVPFTPSV
jgi:hypothetical protein